MERVVGQKLVAGGLATRFFWRGKRCGKKSGIKSTYISYWIDLDCLSIDKGSLTSSVFVRIAILITTGVNMDRPGVPWIT